MTYPGPETEHGKKRMAEDAEMIRNPDRWPNFGALHLKEQPWVKSSERRFGTIGLFNVNDREWKVMIKDTNGETETFSSVEEMVKVWSVD